MGIIEQAAQNQATKQKAAAYDDLVNASERKQVAEAGFNEGLAARQAAELNALQQEAQRQAMMDPRMYDPADYQVGDIINPEGAGLAQREVELDSYRNRMRELSNRYGNPEDPRWQEASNAGRLQEYYNQRGIDEGL